MDASVRVHFYRVETPPGSVGNFKNCLDQLIATTTGRERNVGDTRIGLSNIEIVDSLYSGDVYRVQGENFPSLVATKGPELLELPPGAGLGHHTAFIFDPELSMMGYQITRNSVSPAYFNIYVADSCKTGLFILLPVIKASELQALNSMRPKTFSIKVAEPRDLQAVEDEHRELRDSLINLQGLSGGAYIKVTVGMGNVKGDLERGKIGSMLGWFAEQYSKRVGGVRGLKIEGKTEAGQDAKPLNFLRGYINVSERLNLSTLTPEANYKVRQGFLRRAYLSKRAELEAFRNKP